METNGRSHMEILEEKLAEVKHLYNVKFGADMMSEEEHVP